MRVEDEDVDLIESSERLHGSAAGVPRGGAHDRRAAAAALEGMIHQAPQELHGDILEGERRPVEELEHEQVVVELNQRAHRPMAEGRVGPSIMRARSGAAISVPTSGARTALATSA